MPNKTELLNPKQELFCHYYVFGSGTRASESPDSFGVGNGVRSYAKAYDQELPAQYSACGAEANALLKKPKIVERIRELLATTFNDDAVDARLNQIIFSGRDEHSVQGIREYNKLKQRITEKTDITSGGKTFVVTLGTDKPVQQE